MLHGLPHPVQLALRTVRVKKIRAQQVRVTVHFKRAHEQRSHRRRVQTDTGIAHSAQLSLELLQRCLSSKACARLAAVLRGSQGSYSL